MENWFFAFAAINAAGSLATVGAFIVLFFKDKNKQAQLDKLAGIVGHLDAQNELMQKHNDLVSQQVEILRNNNINDKDTNAPVIEQLREIEEKKLKLSVMPVFNISRVGFRGVNKQLQFWLQNSGEYVKVLGIESEDFFISQPPNSFHKGESKFFICSPRTRMTNTQMLSEHYEIIMLVEDKLNNMYRIVIAGIGTSARILETVEVDF